MSRLDLVFATVFVLTAAIPPATAPVLAGPDAGGIPDTGFAVGQSDAPVTVVEYLSTTCSHCAAFAAITQPFVDTTFIRTGRVRMVIRELPTAPVSVSSASFLLARCNGADGYWEAVRRLLAAQTYVLATGDPLSSIRRAAEVVGLPEAAVERCLRDEAAIRALNTRREMALNQGVDSTPTFIFNGLRLKPGDRLAGGTYEGGELSPRQFAAALRAAERRHRAETPAPGKVPSSAAASPPSAPIL